MGDIPRHEVDWEYGLDVLDYKNYIAVNYTLIRKFGLHAAILAAEFLSEARYWKGRGKLDDGWFFSTVENVEMRTGLSAYYQREAIKELEKARLVEVKYKGAPRKRFVRVNGERVVREANDENRPVVNDQSLTQCTTGRQPSERLAVNPVHDNKYKEQLEEEIKDKKDSDEDVAVFKAVIDYLNEKTGKKFTCGKSNIRHIRARLKEGRTIDDFRHVIDVKCADWLGDQKWSKFLRPETLFGSKFEGYLNEDLPKPSYDTSQYSLEHFNVEYRGEDSGT